MPFELQVFLTVQKPISQYFKVPLYFPLLSKPFTNFTWITNLKAHLVNYTHTKEEITDCHIYSTINF